MPTSTPVNGSAAIAEPCSACTEKFRLPSGSQIASSSPSMGSAAFSAAQTYYGLPSSAFDALAQLARECAEGSREIAAVRKSATSIFNSFFGGELELARADYAQRQKYARLREPESEKFAAARDTRQLTSATPGTDLKLPGGVKGLGFWLMALVCVVVGVADVYNCAKYIQPFTIAKSWLWACVAVSPVISIVIGLKFLHAKLSAVGSGRAIRGVSAFITVLLGLAWVALFAINFGGLYGDTYEPLGLVWQRLLLAAQCLSGIGFSVVVVAAMIDLLESQLKVSDDEEREFYDQKHLGLLRKLDDNGILAGKAQGKIIQLEGVLNNFIEFGETKFEKHRADITGATNARNALFQ